MATEEEQRDQVIMAQTAFRNMEAQTVSDMQHRWNTRAPVRGAIWIAQGILPAPRETDLRDALHDVIRATGSSSMKIPPRDAEPLIDVSCEWIGQRKGVGPEEPQPQLSDAEIYRNISRDVESPMTILYAHGGAFYVGSAAFARSTTVKIAKQTKAQLLSISYRLSPQHTFPAALLDLFTAWMSLLYPAPGARHAAVDPASVVIAADSAGANLVLAMIQAILQMRKVRRDGARVAFHGQTREIPLPSGIALLSAWLDSALILPSWLANGDCDIMQDARPALSAQQPRDDIWPSNPPRGDLHCDPTIWSHMFVSPIHALSWRGSPPMWLVSGEERCMDGIKMVAALAAREGVPVVYSEYMGMPHCFPVFLRTFPQTLRCFRDWTEFCTACVAKRAIQTKGTRIYMPGDREQDLDVPGLWDIPVEKVIALTEEAARRTKPWTGRDEKL